MREVCAYVVANNRPEYLARTLESLLENLPVPVAFVQNDDDHAGMAKNVSRAWERALESDADWFLHWEDDMVLRRPPPLHRMMYAVQGYDLANMILKRDPWFHPIEVETGDVLSAIAVQAEHPVQHVGFLQHDLIFSLNPCLIPRHIMELGWDTDNEAGMTVRTKALGYTYGIWGRPGEEPYLEHIGHERGPGWKL